MLFRLYFLTFSFALLLALNGAYAAEITKDQASGWRLGRLVAFETGAEGAPVTGEMLLGIASNTIKGKNCPDCSAWRFSAPATLKLSMEHLVGEYVLVAFKKDAANEVTEILPLDSKLEPPSECENTKVNKVGIVKIQKPGRIVSAVQHPENRNPFEITFQWGDGGNEFQKLNISDPQTYKCAVDWLKSGREVDLEYIQSLLFNPLEGDFFDVARIGRIKEGRPVRQSLAD